MCEGLSARACRVTRAAASAIQVAYDDRRDKRPAVNLVDKGQECFFPCCGASVCTDDVKRAFRVESM